MLYVQKGGIQWRGYGRYKLEQIDKAERQKKSEELERSLLNA